MIVSSNPTLPLEVIERVIDCLGEDLIFTGTHDTKLAHRALQSCALACIAWVPRCRLHLFRYLQIYSADELTRLTSVLTSTPYPLSWSIQRLHAAQNSRNAPFQHLVPHLLATRAPHLAELQFDWAEYEGRIEDRKETFPFHATFLMQASHLKNLRILHLVRLRFISFNDIRRLLGVLNELTEVRLRSVFWQDHERVDHFKPIIRATKWRMVDIVMDRCQSDYVGFVFWLVPPTKTTAIPANFRGIMEKDSHPVFIQADAVVMTEVLKALAAPTIRCMVSWTCASLGRDCELSSCIQLMKYSTRISGTLNVSLNPAIFISNSKPPGPIPVSLNYTWTSTEPSVLHPRIPSDLADLQGALTARMHTCHVEFAFEDWKLPDVDWASLDLQLSQLFNLQHVELVLWRSEGIQDGEYVAVPLGKVHRTLAADLRDKFPLLHAAKCHLQIDIDGHSTALQDADEQASEDDENNNEDDHVEVEQTGDGRHGDSTQSSADEEGIELPDWNPRQSVTRTHSSEEGPSIP